MSILTAEEIAAVRRPFRAASLLPRRAYHDPAILDWEREHIFRSDWLCVGRESDVPEAGSYRLIEIQGEDIIVVRARDEVVRAFYNVCRHRGTAVCEVPEGKAVRFQCPYHAWIYDLDGSLVRAKHTDDLEDFSLEAYSLAALRLDAWQGFLFLSFDPEAPSLHEWLDDVVDHFARFDLSTLRPAKQIVYDVAANWKFVAENYSECYHCPGLHPQLNRLTPYDLGGDFDTRGPWQGGWMELVGEAETMAMDGGNRGGRPPLAGMTEVDQRRICYDLIWPLTFISTHPDYVLVHRLEPLAVDRTRIVCEWLFDPSTAAKPDFDASDAFEFWDLTNRQDWHVCELQQRGTRSRSWRAGRFSNQEPSVHAFDLMVVDRYADDGISSRRTVRDRYDAPTPPDPLGGAARSDAPVRRERPVGARAAARARATLRD
ncbi:MAG: aromatic ring-hydroxylating dioxygenase subunit alpha [Chloroflexota bacterium]|nr:aromatic ring-hydroxylating dioxygenase subunit alpha [Chloroflexota bacterium]